jgi:deoxycytidine triphosphate deaminase
MPIIIKDELLRLANDPNVKILGNDFIGANFESCSYDLRIGAVFIGDKIVSENHEQSINWNITIKPSQIVTILTLEEVNLPKNVCATVFAINRLSSIGFLILNPGHIDPGYKGPISICAINLSKETKVLSVGSEIFTIIFEKLPYDAEGYKNKAELLALNRKQREENFSINKARKLSNSLFDLIKENEYKSFLIKLINEIMNKRFRTFMTWFFIIVGGLAAIIAILQFSSDNKVEELKKVIQRDSVIQKNLVDSVHSYKSKLDSLNSIRVGNNQK